MSTNSVMIVQMTQDHRKRAEAQTKTTCEMFNKELGDFHALEEEMATHSSVLAWRISGTEEPGGLRSMGSHRVGHD